MSRADLDPSSLEQSVRELANRLDILIAEMSRMRDHWADELREIRRTYGETVRALKAFTTSRAESRVGSRAKKGALEPAELAELGATLRAHSTDDLRQELSAYTVNQLKQLAVYLGAVLPRRNMVKNDLIAWLISEAKFADEHRRLRGY